MKFFRVFDSMSIKCFTKCLVLVITGVMMMLQTTAATKTSAATGNWNAAATWSPAGVPSATDDVIIHGGHTITIDSVFACNNLDVSDATSGTTTLKIITTGCSLTIKGDLKINPGNKSSTITLDAGPGIIDVNGTFSTWGTLGSNAIKVGAGGVLTFKPAVTITSALQSISFTAAGTINFNSSFTDNYNRLYTYSGCIVNFNSSYTVNTTAGSWASKGTAYFSNTGTITANAGLTLYNVQFNSGANTTLANGGGTVLIAGAITLASGSTFNAADSIEVYGAWTNNGGTFNASGTMVTINGSVAIGGTTPTTFPTLQIGAAATASTRSVTMNNNNSCTGLVFSGAGRARALTISTGITLNVNGDLTFNQSTANYSNTLAVNAGTCRVTGNLLFAGADNTVSRIEKISVTSGSFTLDGNITWMSNTAVATEVITVSTGSINFNQSLAMPSGSGTLTVSSTGSINFKGTTAPSFVFGDTIASPVFTAASGSTINFTKGLTSNNAGLTLTSTSTSVFTGSGAITANGNITFGKVQVNGADTLEAGAGIVKVAGAFTLSLGSSFTTNKNIELNGNWVNNGGRLYAAGDTVILNGTAQTISGDSTAFTTLQLGTATAITVVCTMNSNNSCNTLIFNAFTKGRTFAIGTGYTLNITGDVIINQATAAATNSLSVNGGICTVGGNLIFNGTVNTTTYIGKVAVTTGAFVLNGNVSWMSNTAVATEVISVTTGTLTFANSLTMGTGSGTLTVSGAATVNFNGTTAPSFNFGGVATSPVFTTAANCTLNFKAGFTNSNASLTLANPSRAIFMGTGTITPGAALAFSNIEMNTGVTITAGGNISVKGNWTNNGTFVPSTYIVTFSAASPNTQTITKAGGETFYKLTASTAGTTLILANDIAITNTLTMGGENINLNGYTLTLGSGTGAALSRTAGIVYGGNFKRWLPASAITSTSGNYYGLFPIGTITDYRPLAISTTVSPNTAGYLSAMHTDATSVTLVTYTDNEAASIQEIADMKTTLSTTGLAGGTYSINVSFTGFTNAGAVADMKLETYTSDIMGSVGTTAATTGTVINPTIKRTGLTAAQLSNVFVLGTKNKASTPLRQFYYSRKSGNWNDATTGDGTWSYTAGGAGASCDCMPSATSYVVVNTGHTVVVGLLATADYLDINTGATVENNALISFTINRDINMYGTGSIVNKGAWGVLGSLQLSNTSSPSTNGTVSLKKLVVPSGSTYTQIGGTLNLTGDVDLKGTLAIGSSALNISGPAASISGSGNITGSGAITITNDKTFTAGSSLVIGTTVAISGSATFTNNGNVKINGNLTGSVAGSTWVNGANSILEVTGNVLSTGTLNASASPNTVKYTGSGAQSIKTPSTSYYGLVIANAGTKSLAANVFVSDAVTVQDSAVFDLTTYSLSGDADLNMAGNSELKLQRSTNGTYPELTGEYGLHGGTVTINQTAGTATLHNAGYFNLKFTGSRPYDILGISNIQNNFTLQGASTIGNNGSLAIGGAFTYSSSGTSTLGDDVTTGSFILASGTLNDGGNIITVNDSAGWIYNGGTYTSTGTVVFTGSKAQGIGGSLASTFNSVRINNSHGVTLNVNPPAATSIAGSLDLTEGKLYTSATNVLRILADATATQGSATSFIEGPVVKAGNEDFIFPIGRGNRWNRLGISELTDAATEIQAEYFDTRYVDTLPLTGRLRKIDPKEYWMIERTGSADSLKVQLFWQYAWESTIWDCQGITVAHWKDNQWQEEPATTVSGSSCAPDGNGSVQTTGYVSSFSPFTFGGITENALPIQLISFDAVLQSNKVLTRWATALEINNAYFTIERSKDGKSFEPVGRVEGAGNSTTQLDYNWLDEQPEAGVSYYRLKQTDFDGQYSYSPIVSVNLKPSGTVKLFPNPAQNEFCVNVSTPAEKLQVSIYNLAGNQVLNRVFDTQGSSLQRFIISEISSLPSGLYFVSVNNGGEEYREKLMVTH